MSQAQTYYRISERAEVSGHGKLCAKCKVLWTVNLAGVCLCCLNERDQVKLPKGRQSRHVRNH